VAYRLPPLPTSSLFEPESPFLVPSLQRFHSSERPERVKGPKRLAALGGEAAYAELLFRSALMREDAEIRSMQDGAKPS